MQKDLVAVFVMVASAQTARLGLDANGNTAKKMFIPNIEDRFTIQTSEPKSGLPLCKTF